MQKIDLKSKKLLFELDFDSRQSIKALAKKVGLSEPLVKYKLNKLQKDGVIKAFPTLFDLSKLGYLYYRIYFSYENVSPERETKIIEYFKEHRFVVWFVSTIGSWDLEILCIAKNHMDIDKLRREILEKFGDNLKNHSVSISIINYHFKKKFLLNQVEKTEVTYGKEPKFFKLQNGDEKIIKLFANNARSSIAEISNETGLHPRTVKSRIVRMKKEGLISAFRTWTDIFKLGFKYYKVLIKLKNFPQEEEKTMIEFCNQNPFIVYMITCIGDWDIELELELENEEQLRQTLIDFKKKFGNIIIKIETLQITAEHKMHYYPIGKESDSVS